jgi:DNA mismatch repair protein MutS
MAAGRRQQREEAPGSNGLPSLLWPEQRVGVTRGSTGLSGQAASDLDLQPLVQALSGRQADRIRFVAGVLAELPNDPTVIAYRADVLTNLLEDAELRARLEALLPLLSRLTRERQRAIFAAEWTVGGVVERLGDLEMYVDAALGLAAALDGPRLTAPALRALQAAVNASIETAEFAALRAELPRLREQLNEMQSITVGVNVSHDFRPESATILSIDREKIEGRSGLLGRLLGRAAAREGITRLRGSAGTNFRAFFPPMAPNVYGSENELVRDLQRLIDHVVTPVGEAIERYVSVQTRVFATLEAELSFLLNGVALVQRLHAAGLPTCRPDIAPREARVCSMRDAYNVSLALRTLEAAPPPGAPAIVTNDVSFAGGDPTVWILTGPNRGGKTTYARAVGLAHLLAQAGLHVPARSACISPIDTLWTHFPTLETTTPGEGRLDDEAIRLGDIFRSATPHSLILLNEVLNGTSTLEALGLAHDAVRGLHLLGARAIYVTHLHELAARVDEINASTPGPGVVGSLVAEVDTAGDGDGHGHRRTFRIRPSPPLGISYASEIALQHGISYPQLVELLRDRGVVSQDEDVGTREEG